MKIVLLVSIICLSYIYSAHAEEIKYLPGLNISINFRQYSGYINVDVKNNRNLFYWFVESQKSPENDPVVLWLNGGPGCSSLFGFLTENGPFRLEDENTLKLNSFSWNNVANMIYLEAPAGVGFSYSDVPSDYTTNDNKTADDNYKALLGFFKIFPQFQKNAFYIAGESYAGHYVPQLALRVHEGNKKGNSRINLAGTLAGNPSTNATFDGNGYMHFLVNHALTSFKDYDAAYTACGNGNFHGNGSVACKNAILNVQNALGNVNPYDIYATCNGKPSVDGYCFTYNAALRATAGSQTFVPCMNVTAPTVYFSREDVRKAIHVSPKANVWEVCSTILNYGWITSNMLPIYDVLVQHYKVLLYSGDVDSCVPFIGTQKSAEHIAVTGTRGPWTHWSVGGQVAGYQVKLGDNLWYITIKDAGHMVPQFKPVQALIFFSKFISGKPFEL